jgi:prevent-host-death family protein
MAEIPLRELRSHTSEVLRRVEDGEELDVTVNGRAVARLVPMPRRPRFLPAEVLLAHPADPGLLDDIKRFALLAARDDAIRAVRLRTLQDAFKLDPLPVDEQVADAWSEMRVALRTTGRRLAANDSWIAATAIAHDLPLVTQDRDYDGVPGLDVVKL